MGNRPSEMMDREKAYIPELQISFMEHIAMPIYKCVQKPSNHTLPLRRPLYCEKIVQLSEWNYVSQNVKDVCCKKQTFYNRQEVKKMVQIIWKSRSAEKPNTVGQIIVHKQRKQRIERYWKKMKIKKLLMRHHQQSKKKKSTSPSFNILTYSVTVKQK